jgi:hypothetical protein
LIDQSIAQRCQDIAAKACGFVGVCEGVSPEQSVQILADLLKTAREELGASDCLLRSAREDLRRAQNELDDILHIVFDTIPVMPRPIISTRDGVQILADRYIGR